MKFQAHPLVVAAALGLIGPGALADEEEPEAEALCDGCSDSAPTEPSPEAAAGLWAVGGEWTWAPGEAPDAVDFHRVELAWLKESQGR